MVTILPQEEGWAPAFKEIGKGAGQGYQRNADQMALQKAILSLGDKPQAEDIVRAITNTRTYLPESKKEMIEGYVGAENIKLAKEKAKLERQKEFQKEQAAKEKADKEREATRKIVDQLDIPPEQKETLRETADLKTAQKALFDQIGKKGELNEADKLLQKERVLEYVELEKELPKLESMKENVDYVRGLAKNLTGGPVSGLLGTKLASEIEAASFPLLQPIIKMFNPTGPLAQKKLEQLKDMYHIKPTDLPWKIEGKLNAIEHFNKQILARTKQRIELLRKHNFLPPRDVIEKFDNESETIMDVMLEYGETMNQQAPKGLPPANENAGVTKRNKKTGKSYKSDGKTWIEI